MRIYYQPDLLLPQSDTARQLFSSYRRGIQEVLLTGGRGKGKTVALALYAINRARKNPRIKIAWARSEYSTIKTTIIPTLQDKIFRYPMGDSRHKHPKNPFKLLGGPRRPEALLFDNLAEIRFIGLDDKSKTRGYECDLAIINEATREETDEVWGEFGAVQAGGRASNWRVNGKKFSQIIADTNPSHPYHWLYTKFHPDEDRPDYVPDDMLWLAFTHHDNPALIETPGVLNYDGEKTIEDLLKRYPPGHEQDRMVWGKWVAAEGLVFPMWNPKLHVKKMSAGDFDALSTRWIMGIDHGGGENSPFAVGLTAINDGKYRKFKELAMTKCTIRDVIGKTDALLERYGIEKRRITAMHAETAIPGFNQALREANYPVVEADKDILAGIDHQKQLIGDNRFEVNANSLDERCPIYAGPQGFKEEVLGYQHLPKEQQATSKFPDHPIAKNNHWMDETRYELYGDRHSGPRKRREPFTVRRGNRRRGHL